MLANQTWKTLTTKTWQQTQKEEQLLLHQPQSQQNLTQNRLFIVATSQHHYVFANNMPRGKRQPLGENHSKISIV